MEKNIKNKKGYRSCCQALVQSLRSYKSLFYNGALPQCIFERTTLRILKVNKAAVRLYGYSQQELQRLRILDLFPAEQQQEASFLDSLTERKKLKNQRIGQVNKNGHFFMVEWAQCWVLYKGRDCALATFKDISALIRLQEQLVSEKVLQEKKILQATLGAQEKERAFIGKELHDNINQVLTTALLCLGVAEDQGNAEYLHKSRSHLQKAIGEIRALSKSLIPPSLKDLGLVEAIEECLDQYRSLNIFTVSFYRQGPAEALCEQTQLCLYRILQEQMNNIVKYAGAHQVTIHLCITEAVELQIKDDGRGFDPTARRQGVGISNMFHRAEALGGRLDICSAPGQGCRVMVVLPLAGHP